MKTSFQKYIKNSLLLLIGASFLLSSSGIFILLHHCSSEHHTYSFFMQTEVDCHEHHLSKQTHDCQYENNSPSVCEIEASSCCDDHSLFLKLTADFIDSKLNSQITQIFDCAKSSFDYAQFFNIGSKLVSANINYSFFLSAGLPIFIRISQFLL